MTVYRLNDRPAPLGYRGRHCQRWAASRGVTTAVELLIGLSLFAWLAGCAAVGAERRAVPAPTATWSSPTASAPSTSQPPAVRRSAPTYEAPTRAGLKAIVKSPDAHEGETYLIYGVVFQADPITGATAVLADIGHEWAADDNAYDTSIVLAGTTVTMANIVEDARFVAEVRVAGAITYESSTGTRTVPQLYVNSIEIEDGSPTPGADVAAIAAREHTREVERAGVVPPVEFCKGLRLARAYGVCTVSEPLAL